jgi:tRNA threonylcarbamoyl adenosine modification protein YeaZ
MKILAIEFSTDERSVAVLVDGDVRGTAVEAATRATPAFGMITKALQQAGVGRQEIECLAIGLGPGSYTGIRAAIALAQGWQLARPVKLLGIGSVECLALAAQSKGWFGQVDFAIDAQRNEFYLARYEISQSTRREIEPLRLATREEVNARVATGGVLAGPALDGIFVGARALIPTAADLGRLEANRTDFVPGEKLEPIYLRETNFVKAPPPRVLPA